MDRRHFLQRTAGTLALLAEGLPRVRKALAGTSTPPDALARDEAFWAEVRQAFSLDPAVVNLDHGWTNPAPRAALDALDTHARRLEALPAEQLMAFWEGITNTTVRAALAGVMGVPGEQLALVRNATEALDTVLLGVPLQPGDEVVCSAHDYYAMLDALEQRQARDGIVLHVVRLPIPAPSLDALAVRYEAAITPRTRLVLLTHPSNLTGQMLPVRRIADAAHAVGAEVVVDGAQSLGLIPESPVDLGADYYGASLHKWIGAPVGMGVLWMRPELVAKVWPLVPPPEWTEGMARFEWIGTAPEYVGPAVLPALALHATLGPARKAARLHYLTAYWRRRAVAALPSARFYTLSDASMSCGLCTVELPGHDSETLQQRLRTEHGILVQAMRENMGRAPEIRGLRVSPNVYTSPAELDRLVAALVAVASP